MLQLLFIAILFNCNIVNTFECYYCNDEQGYYCPHPFPSKSMYNNDAKYYEQMKNIAVSSSNKPLTDPIISCFKTDYYNSNYKYRNTYRGIVKQSMNNSITCQSNYRLSQNSNYPGWEKTYCCSNNRCNQARIIFINHPILIFSLFYIIQILSIDL